MKKLVLIVAAGCMTAAVTGAFAETTANTQDTAIRLAQAVRTPSSPSESGRAGAELEGGMMMKDGMMMMMMPDGRMSRMQKSDKMMSEMMMREGKPMTGTHMMMMSGGKMYMMEDKRMSDGKMMSEGMMMKDGMMKR